MERFSGLNYLTDKERQDYLALIHAYKRQKLEGCISIGVYMALQELIELLYGPYADVSTQTAIIELARVLSVDESHVGTLTLLRKVA